MSYICSVLIPESGAEIGFAATNVRGAVIANSGHWIMEEQPQQAIALIVPFLAAK
jgi:pimeloyl-ACP methyl ester carboxylesterase